MTQTQGKVLGFLALNRTECCCVMHCRYEKKNVLTFCIHVLYSTLHTQCRNFEIESTVTVLGYV